MWGMSDEPLQTGALFSQLGIAPVLLEVLDRLKFTHPTPIQEKAIPPAIQGKDVVGIAQTGTGKTLAFGIPMIQSVGKAGGQGLVVLPTRELALQVAEVLSKVGRDLHLRTCVLIGGTGYGAQIDSLRKNPHIIIATPGRLIDHLKQKTASLSHVNVVVFDEADRMLDMGFAPQIKEIFNALPKERQTMLFSATMPAEIMKMATGHMKLPIRIEVAPAGTTAERVTQEIFIIGKEERTRLLDKLLSQYQATTLIFMRTKHGAKKLVRSIRAMGHTVAELHSNRSLGQRKDALEGFRSGKYRVLVATDIASRGIDVTGIGLVLNYDLPTSSEDYVHRIGRTARAGAGGHAISFVAPEQRRDLKSIERLIRQTLPVSPIPELPPRRAEPIMPPRGPIPSRSRSPRSSSGYGYRGSGGNRYRR